MFPPSPAGMFMGGPDGSGYEMEGGTVMVFNVDPDKTNCDKLFNVFCLYGNVCRIMFMRNKPSNCMVQLGDYVAAGRAIENLNQSQLFGRTLKMVPSNQGNIKPVPTPVELPDGTPSYKDYTDSKVNRFQNRKQASMNRIVPPKNSLYFWNVPLGTEEDIIQQLFKENGAAEPSKIHIFKNRNAPDTKTIAGFVEFESDAEAMDALALTNYAKIDNPDPEGKFPYLMKLTFLSPADAHGMGGNSAGGGYGARRMFRGRGGGMPGGSGMMGMGGGGGMMMGMGMDYEYGGGGGGMEEYDSYGYGAYVAAMNMGSRGKRGGRFGQSRNEMYGVRGGRINKRARGGGRPY